MFNPLTIPGHIYHPMVKDFVQSDDFDYVCSLILPYHDWLVLRESLTEGSEAIKLATVIINNLKYHPDQELSPDKLVDLINQSLYTNFSSMDKKKINIDLQIKALSEQFETDPIQKLEPAFRQELSDSAQQHLLPLIETYLKNDVLKNQFLTRASSNPKLLNILYYHRNLFADIQSSPAFGEIQSPLITLCNALDSLHTYTESDFHDGLNTARTHGQKLTIELQAIVLSEYLKQDGFYNLLGKLMPQKDIALIRVTFNSTQATNSRDNAYLFALFLLEQGISLQNLEKDPAQVITSLKSQFPELTSVNAFDIRLLDAKNYLGELRDNTDKHLLAPAIINLTVEKIIPTLLHKTFRELIDATVGFLSEKDLRVLLSTLDVQNSAENAKTLFKFVSYIKNKDKHGLARDFLALSEDEEGRLILSNSVLQETMEMVHLLTEEVMRCHCYYNQHQTNGLQYPDVDKPKLWPKLSKRVRGIRVDANPEGYWSYFSRRVFFVQGIRQGLPKASSLSHENSKPTIKRLRRVQAHILRPLWWSSNISRASYLLLRYSRNVYFQAISAYFALINAIKRCGNQIMRIVGFDYHFNISARNPHSEDYNETTFSYSRMINHLKPLEAEDVQVEKRHCPSDVVQSLEQFVTEYDEHDFSDFRP